MKGGYMNKPIQTAAIKDILINQGADFRLQLRLCIGTSDAYSPIDISGYTFMCKIKEDASDIDTLAVADCNIIDAPHGLMEIFFDNLVTSAIDTDGVTYDDLKQCAWDLYATPPEGDTLRIMNGTCYVSPGVSDN